MDDSTKPPKVFISYAWEDDIKPWVLDLAKRLRSDGVHAILDIWEVHAGDPLPEFMENAVRESDYVLVICTPLYKNKSDHTDINGVKYEKGIITGELFSKGNQRKFIPVLRKGIPAEAAPTWARGKIYIDFRDNSFNENNYQELLKTVYGRQTPPPPIGKPHEFKDGNNRETKHIFQNSTQPKKIGIYEIKSELGHGGMGTVYLGYDPRIERDVAIKVLPSELLQSDPQSRFRFIREAQIIANLELPSIVPVYDVGEENDQPYFVMRYMRGGSLTEKIRARMYSIKEITRILEQLAPGIDEAHAKGIIHRDLKPGNILFDGKSVPYISDFGIAKLIESQTGNTIGGAIIGTPAYMSPEQAAGEYIDGRTDIYALGVILCEMLTGKRPYDGEHLPAFHSLDVKPSFLPRINTSIRINAIISKAMAKDKKDRFSTASEMIEALKAVMHHSASRRKKNYLLTTIASLLIITLIGVRIFREVPSQIATSEATIEISKTETQITETETASIPTETATIAPNDATKVSPPPLPILGGADKIAFLNNNNIWIMNVDGSGLQSVTNDKDKKFNLEWMPDGNSILYITGKIVKKVDIETSRIETITSFSASDYFESFHISPDGKQVAISLARELHVVPFDLENFKPLTQKDDLLAMNGCIFYNAAEVKDAIWSDDGEKLTIKFTAVVRKHFADTLRVIDIRFCKSSKPLRLDEFPASRFSFTETIVSFDWDGDQLFFMNSDIRNGGFGNLGIYNYGAYSYQEIAPIDNICCYRDAAFSPDGTYAIFAFQDIRLAPESPIMLYYVYADSLTTNGTFHPLPLPIGFFTERKDAPAPVLRAAK